MKSEKRHELQKNELADWLGNHVEGATEYFWPVVGGVVVAFALAIGIVWYLNARESAAAIAWDKYYQAFAEREREAELKKVAEVYSDSAAAQWAQLGSADLSLAQATKLMFSDKSEATSRVKEAIDGYQSVLSKARDPELTTRAQFGMARAQETMCQPEEARKFYELVAKSNKDSALGKEAARAAARLADPKTVEFLKWFAAAEPRKPAPIGHGGIPGMPPFNVPNDLPERPDLSLPGPLNFDPGKLPEDSPKFDFPKADDTPKPDAPKTDAPKSETPKSEAPPAAAPKGEAPKSEPAESKKPGE
jgi:hypothetical protein